MTVSSIGYDHMEQFSRNLGTLTIDPIYSVVQYLFPFLGTYFSMYFPLRSDVSLEATMPNHQVEGMLREIQNLTDCAGIQSEVTPYIALSHTFSSSGGTYSFSKPILYMPEQCLFRRGGLSPFPQERAEENLAAHRWIFSDNEVRFFIARELGHMQEGNSLLKLAIKVAVLAAMCFTVMGWAGGSLLYIGTLGLYIFIQRQSHAKADILGVKILEQRGIENPKQVAIQALEKIRQQNLYRRENSAFARLFILESGNNLLDFMSPFLTNRIENLRCEENF